MRGQAFDVSHPHHIGRDRLQGFRRIFDDAAAAEEVVGGEAGGEAGGAAGGQNVRRARGVVAEGDGAVVAEEGRAGVFDFRQQSSGVVDCDVQVLGREQVSQAAGFVFVLDEDQAAEVAERLDCLFAPREAGDLTLQFLRGGFQCQLAPGDENARPELIDRRR
jgi:hypothetical protein